MPRGKMRVAVCQLECRPALTIADVNYLREPALTQDRAQSLGALARHGLDFAEIQDKFSEAYHAWQSERLRHILAFLTSTKPAVDLVIFPEASIPLRLLTIVRDFAVQHSVTVVAGTHSYLRTSESSTIYRELGVSSGTIEQWGEVSWSCTAVLPIFSGRKAFFHRKRVPSVFEITDVTPREQMAYTLAPLNLTLAGQRCRVLPLVCAEALQQYKIPINFDLAIICAYNIGTDLYDPFIAHHTFNQIPVVFCNDGQFGGSGIHVSIDRRMNIWWWGEPFLGRLPAGDGILIAEIDWDHLATQVGVANPQPAVRLNCIAAVTYEDSASQAYQASLELISISKGGDNTSQHERIKQLLNGDLTQIQRLKALMLHRLTKEGTADVAWWSTLSRDCQIPGIVDLGGLQTIHAALCAESLLTVIQSGNVQDINALGNAVKLMNTYKKAAGEGNHSPGFQNSVIIGNDDITIDRESESSEVIRFLEHPQQVACLVFGLDAVGKTTVVEKAIAKGGYRKVARLSLAPDVTGDFFAVNILSLLDFPRAAKVANPISTLRDILPARLRAIRVLIIQDAENLLAHVMWRDAALEDAFRILITLAKAAACKVIIESSTHFDLPIDDPNLVKRVPIRGLQPDDGLALLNQQLRRVGLEPSEFVEGERREIVEILSGHPGATILAADYVENSGIGRVRTDLIGKTGIYTRIVQRVLQKLHLGEQEQHVLSLLAEARVPIPIRIISNVTNFDPLPAIQDLRRLALVDRLPNDFIAITGILRGFGNFAIPNAIDLKAFHIAAAMEFVVLAARARTVEQLRWTVEARYHAFSAGRDDLAPELENLADGALGALATLVKRTDYEAAFPLLQQLLKTHRSAEVLELGAIVYARQGNCGEALVLAKEAVSLEPQRVWVLTEVGRISLFSHQVEVAEDALRIARATGTDSTYIATLEGQVFERKRQPDRAIAAFRRGVRISEYDAWPHFYLGRTLIEQGHPEEAKLVLEEGNGIEESRYRPRQRVLTALRTQLALAYLHTDDAKNAEQWLSLVAEEDTINPEVARAFSYLRLKKGETNIASRALANLDPERAKNRHERAQIHLFRGLFFLTAGESARASEEFNLANLSDPQNVFVLLRWSDTLFGMAKEAKGRGDHDAAEACARRVKEVAEKVLKFDSDNSQSLAILEQLHEEFHIQ